MYLSQSIEWQGASEQMVGIIPAACQVHKKPIGRGYAQLESSSNHPWPFTAVDTAFSAHEFHYSELSPLPPECQFAYRMLRGSGINGQADGFIYKNLLANYTHLRSVDATPWVASFLGFVAQKQQQLL
jgi:cobyrinic acid a,c-diamide synthase